MGPVFSKPFYAVSNPGGCGGRVGRKNSEHVRAEYEEKILGGKKTKVIEWKK